MSKKLTKEIAQKALGCADSDDLSKYSEMADDAAQILAGFPGPLELNSLKSLSDESAKALLPHESGLHLNGLQEITDSLALILSKYQGGILELEGIREISDSALKVLARFKAGLLSLGLTELSDKQANFVTRLRGSDTLGDLSLPKLKTLSTAAARCLGKDKGRCLNLDGLVELSDEAVLGLIQHDAISVNRLQKISETALKALVAYHTQGGTLYALTLRERILAAKARKGEKKAVKKISGAKKA